MGELRERGREKPESIGMLRFDLVQAFSRIKTLEEKVLEFEKKGGV